MSVFKRFLLIASAMVLAIAPLQARAADLKKVVISQAFQSMLYLPLYVGIDKGFFKDEGLDVDRRPPARRPPPSPP